MGNPPQSYGTSPVIWDHTVFPATRRKWTRHALTPAIQTSTRFLPRRDGRLSDLGGWLYTEMVYPSSDGHPSKCINRARRTGRATGNYCTLLETNALPLIHATLRSCDPPITLDDHEGQLSCSKPLWIQKCVMCSIQLLLDMTYTFYIRRPS